MDVADIVCTAQYDYLLFRCIYLFIDTKTLTHIITINQLDQTGFINETIRHKNL